MKFNKKSVIFFLIIGLIFAVIVSGCLSDTPSHRDDHPEGDGHGHNDSNAEYGALNNTSIDQILNGSKILVAVSVVPQVEFVEKVGGNRVITISMIPPGAGHTYDPSPRQLEDLSKADIYMELGSGEPFEKNNMGTFREINPEMIVVNSSTGVAPLASGNSSDPHVWTSPKCAMIMVENTYKGLAGIDPENASYYRQNADAYLQELQELDAELEAEFSNLKTDNFMVYHPAWGYFSRDYGFNQIAVEVDGKEPTPKVIVEYIKLAKQNNISVIFVQEQVSVTGATAIAEGFGGKVYVIDPLAKNYVGNMKAVGKVLAEEMS